MKYVEKYDITGKRVDMGAAMDEDTTRNPRENLHVRRLSPSAGNLIIGDEIVQRSLRK